jgi:hypothetical protein
MGEISHNQRLISRPRLSNSKCVTHSRAWTLHFAIEKIKIDKEIRENGLAIHGKTIEPNISCLILNLGLLFSAVRKFWKLSTRGSLMAKQRDKAAAGIPSQFFNHLAVKKLAAIV